MQSTHALLCCNKHWQRVCVQDGLPASRVSRVALLEACACVSWCVMRVLELGTPFVLFCPLVPSCALTSSAYQRRVYLVLRACPSACTDPQYVFPHVFCCAAIELAVIRVLQLYTFTVWHTSTLCHIWGWRDDCAWLYANQAGLLPNMHGHL